MRTRVTMVHREYAAERLRSCGRWFRSAVIPRRADDVAAEAIMNVRTRYYRRRYRAQAVWGAGVQVRGRLTLRGPGLIFIGDGCMLGTSSGQNFIHANGPGCVRVGEGCHLDRFEIWATDNVTIARGVHVRGSLRVEKAGRVVLGEGCEINNLEIVSAGDVTIGAGVHIREYARLEGAGHITIGNWSKINTLEVSTAGDVALGPGVNARGRAVIGGPGCVSIGARSTVESGGVVIHTELPTVNVRIGSECGINGLDVYATEDVTIGDRCMIGTCSMMTTDFHSTNPDRWSPNAVVKRGRITVGSNVWIAMKTVLTKGVSIGDNSVVSIGTIVRHDVPANVIVASHEQRIVKKLADPHDSLPNGTGVLPA